MGEEAADTSVFGKPTTCAGRVGERMLTGGLLAGYACGLSLPTLVQLPEQDRFLLSVAAFWVGAACGAVVGLVSTREMPPRPAITDAAARSAVTWWRAVQLVSLVGGVAVLVSVWNSALEARLVAPAWPILLLFGAETCTEAIARGRRLIGLPAVFLLLASIPPLGVGAGVIASHVDASVSAGRLAILAGMLVFSVVAMTAAVKTLRIGGWLGPSRIRFF